MGLSLVRESKVRWQQSHYSSCHGRVCRRRTTTQAMSSYPTTAPTTTPAMTTPYAKPVMKRKRALETLPPAKKGLTDSMHATLALLQHIPALATFPPGRRATRRGGVDAGDMMIHALGAVMSATQVTPLPSRRPALAAKEDEARPCANCS
ncbi:hypothetical protein SDRG_04819 [Saprolegnia diclina VS20]|uniref:Uncharacterized protein n=1 Tax=Saprolegnia diclina (strain VS20) TaxID=1156394 RepID=T0QUT1_SAPDV|nr:hypothetical protein SDRG_04819 [Saprolegnia diclina VS20]EQC37795.1 hypothetical protein SDRG_04819 [Saprolegnia diclina VS20]|eukprot:XP_008608728.1 hypothetical protein SDRG_04819 [Saprolegnia diclina VS20]